ncbi:hypothetical protein FJ422_30340 [Mesorhizobium sp. B2-6-3]|uniref:DUF6950 family protein n=1 Tax=Mesorhizobium sp. B2-6-3 TaxID=2589914 RepID=UPI001129E54F|nr:hypothetical protein [Mesorhizobium sp. B2-6-3]TPJ76187.1 hypothetical protein FJ422_30340 [Mesorhizobium sp. B2-6-3]
MPEASKPDLLALYLAEERQRPFAWGQGNGDCLLFLLGWAERAAGRMASVAWRGAYRDEAGARMCLEAFGGAPWAVCDVLGPPRMGSEARRGDVGLFETEGWHLGMICTGRLWVMRAHEQGIRYARLKPELVWSMGFA